ncbi:MAG: Minf_1886 family protein [Gemmatimonadota bacterium]
MPELQFADGVLARIRARAGGRYDERAYLFMLSAIEFLQARFETRRHVSGAELAWGCRDMALERFGLLARTVLGCWGVTCTADFGRLVYTLVEVGLLSTQPGDREEDFHGIYDFTEAMDQGYLIRAFPREGLELSP